MRIILVVSLTIAAAGLLGGGSSAATTSAGAISKAATKASLVTKVFKCRTVRRCSTFNCAWQEECN
jgi:hypothetical protein